MQGHSLLRWCFPIWASWCACDATAERGKLKPKHSCWFCYFIKVATVCRYQSSVDTMHVVQSPIWIFEIVMLHMLMQTMHIYSVETYRLFFNSLQATSNIRVFFVVNGVHRVIWCPIARWASISMSFCFPSLVMSNCVSVFVLHKIQKLSTEQAVHHVHHSNTDLRSQKSSSRKDRICYLQNVRGTCSEE